MLNAHFKQMMETRCHSQNGLQRAQRIKTVLPYCPFLESWLSPLGRKKKVQHCCPHSTESAPPCERHGSTIWVLGTFLRERNLDIWLRGFICSNLKKLMVMELKIVFLCYKLWKVFCNFDWLGVCFMHVALSLCSKRLANVHQLSWWSWWCCLLSFWH